jgi:diguanylate cyclase (GGDEF)-like protein
MAPRTAAPSGAQQARVSLRRTALSPRSASADDPKVTFPPAGSLARSEFAWCGGALLRGPLVAFALLICLVMAGMFGLDILHERSVAVSVARSGAQNLAASLAQQADDTFEAVNGVLLAISSRVQSTPLQALDRERLRDVMAALVTTMPRLHDLFVVDRRGRLVASNSSSVSPANVEFGGAAFFRFHQSNPGSGLHISGPVRGTIANRWLLNLSHRLNDADGSFAGVAVAQVTLDYFDQSYAAVDVGRLGAVSLMADDGTLIFRRPQVRLGDRLSALALFADPYGYQPSGWYVNSSLFDGLTKLHAFRRLDRFPLVVNVAVAEVEYLAEWRSDALLNVAILFVATVLIVGLAAVLGTQIDRRREAEHKLALVDALTGLANRRQFDSVLEREWRRAVREHSPLALLMIDVDHFKAYNDRYGHRRGDDVLATIAQAIEATVVRPGDVAARYGGEEFAVILPATDTSSALTVAERIRCAIAALAVPHADSAACVTSVSVGVASIVPRRSDDRATLIDAADAALYDAKRAGRNRSVTAPGVFGVLEPPRLGA